MDERAIRTVIRVAKQVAVNINMRLKSLRDVHRIQNATGVWDQSQYSLGLANGLELALSILEDREPVLKQMPTKAGIAQHPPGMRGMLEGFGGPGPVAIDGHAPNCPGMHNPRVTPCSPVPRMRS